MSKLYPYVKESAAVPSEWRSRLGGLVATALSLVGFLMPSASAREPPAMIHLRAAGATASAPRRPAAGELREPKGRPALTLARHNNDMSAHRRARKALRSESASSSLPDEELRADARYYLALGFGASAGDSPHLQALREALHKELQTLPGVVVSTGHAPPSAKTLEQRRLKAFYIDGTIHLQSSSWSGGQKIACEVRMSVATWPHRAVKMMSTEGAALETGATTAEQMMGQRDCLMATVSSTRNDIQQYLETVQ